MAEEVKYEMSLNDMVSPKLKEAEVHAKHFEGTLGSLHSSLGKLGERALSVGETLGISFAYIKLEEFFHEGIEKAHEFHVAEGQLENTLKNVGERAGMTAEELVAMARSTAKEIPFTTTQIIGMETALSRFSNLTPQVYQRVLAASADIATALKRDGTEVASALGRIMEMPAQNARLLRQFNITLTAEQRKYLLMLQQTGQTAKEQTFIFEELAQKGYGGAAKAAADTDPLFRYNKIIGSIKLEMGNLGVAILQDIAPGLETMAGLFKSGYDHVKAFGDYISKNLIPILKEVKEYAIALGVGVGIAGAAFLATYPAVITYGVSLAADTVITGALSIATGVLTAAQWLLNAAITANPFVALGVAIAAVAAGMVYAYKHSAKFRAVLSGIKEVGVELFPILKGLGDVIAGIFTFDFSQIKTGLGEVVAGVKNFNLKGAFIRGIQQSFDEDKADAEREKRESTIGKLQKKGEKPKLLSPMSMGPKAGTTSKVTGSKVINVHVQINQLGCGLVIKTTNINQALDKLHDHVTQVLTGAVNDSQYLAGE